MNKGEPNLSITVTMMARILFRKWCTDSTGYDQFAGENSLTPFLAEGKKMETLFPQFAKAYGYLQTKCLTTNST